MADFFSSGQESLPHPVYIYLCMYPLYDYLITNNHR